MAAIEKRKKEKVTEMKVKITWKEIKRQKALLIWSAFIVLYGVIFCYLPLGGWLMAFQDYRPKDGLLHSQFVGLAKFQQLFSDATFLRVIRNTLAMGVINLVATFFMAILFAILLNDVKSQGGKKVVQTISYLPHFLSWIIVTGILHDALSGTGIVNEFLLKFGILDQPLNFFAHPKFFWPIVAFANVWKETGWNAIIYLSAITSIDPSLYEAANIDGAGRWQKLRYFFLPLTAGTTETNVILSITGGMKSFALFYMLTGGGPGTATRGVSMLIYDTAFMDYKFYKALTMSTVLFGIILTLVLLGRWLGSRRNRVGG